MGTKGICPTNSDLEGKVKFYRSICALKDIQKGELFTSDNLGGKRPGTGIPTKHLSEAWGKKAQRDFSSNELLDHADLGLISRCD